MGHAFTPVEGMGNSTFRGVCWIGTRGCWRRSGGERVPPGVACGLDCGSRARSRLPPRTPATHLVAMSDPITRLNVALEGRYAIAMGPLARNLIGAAVVASLVTGTPWPAAAQIQLDAMTFNIRTSNIPDGDNAWPYRKELVAETIRRFAPHVVGMQEAISEQIEYLASALPEYRWLGIDRRLNGGQGLSEATPIFYRHDELAPIESGNFWLTATPDVPPPVRASGAQRRRRRGGGRIVTWARFHHLATGRAVYVFNTHLSLRRGQRQIDSVNLILERVGALPAGSAVIVLGDFNNVAEESDLWRTATSHGLDDAWVVADEAAGSGVDLERLRSPG